MASADPITEFMHALERAASHHVDTVPVALATAGGDGRPSIRMVLCRQVDARGFVFHTNYNSRKGRDLAANMHAALCFHWPTLEEQIRVEGHVEQLTSEESDLYFAERPRGSQIGAWASEQSAELESREALEARYRSFERQFAGGDVPRPPFWGGYRVIPTQVEFWYGRPDRLHDRVLYRLERDAWRITRLYP
ncbi:MAG: pyridoxamine 5'-phosphate oxidase [Vicinamibacterales bacterium]